MLTAESRSSLVEALQALEPRMSQLTRPALREALAPIEARLIEPLPEDVARESVEAAVKLCRGLYIRSRSGEALPLARAALRQAGMTHEHVLMRRAATVCGALSADSADVVGAIEHHVFVLRLATAAGDRFGMGLAWNNIGLAMGISGNYELAARCYRRCIDLAEGVPNAAYNRYVALFNLADSHFQLGSYSEGLGHALTAWREQTSAFRDQDLLNALFLQRNLVRLLVVMGRVSEAEPHVAECSALAERMQTARALIAAATTRATYELAVGHTDVALTRLEQALGRARELPAALRDTLACVIRAEEAAGNIERALMRLGELSEHVYRFAIQRAREHVELSGLSANLRMTLEHDEEQARARLTAKVPPPAAPEAWSALDRLAVSAVLRMDPSGWHGKRVGALVKALAMQSGVDPLHALEMGLAAELHDIGMMSVPEAILRKRGALNEAERAIIRRHTEAGAEILRDDRHARVFMAREIVTYHHARW
ncbi:MAG: HD domain-containing phosphohydrolase, partial [Bacillota bacterium]